jgi:hypothetical protein
MAPRFAILSLATLIGGAALAGCDGCFGTYVPGYETTFVAALSPAAGTGPGWVSRSTSGYPPTGSADPAQPGTLIVRLRGANPDHEQQQMSLSLPLPVTAGQQVEVEMVAPAADLNPPSDVVVIGGSPLPEGEIRIDDVSGCSTGACPPSFAEKATGGFTILAAVPLSVHVDATITLASGTTQQIVGDLTFPTTTTEVPGYCAPPAT